MNADLLPLRLTLLTDGVVEARNTEGKLLGFEDAAQLSRDHASEIAERAQHFGQQDDITVVTLERLTRATDSAEHTATPGFAARPA